jgi:hypothetical protein
MGEGPSFGLVSGRGIVLIASERLSKEGLKTFQFYFEI